ncbi:DEAD/DEAH box helicase [Nocardioides nanhaiensis]|uniref:DEAD/DEAH box helicase n=1 Tax=Nocardioides nanhaiensis TaxID=1476871 RepID=A0ABP8VPC8_9ACTN
MNNVTSSTDFGALGVPADLVAILADRGITTPSPIQAATLPDSLRGRDVLGRGRTGSGKTYAFLLPLVARLAGGRRAAAKSPRALIVAPTRELVGQIEQALAPLAASAGLTTQTVFGGVGQGPQVNGLRRGTDIVLACPGRLEDLIQQGHCSLGSVQVTVLDEADHMADLGFLPAVKRLLDATPRGSQRMLFSATLDNAIDVLVKRYLSDPAVHEADSAQSPVSTMDHHVLHLGGRDQRLPVLIDLASAPGRTVVFTRTKHGAKALARQLNKSGVPAVDLHGNLSQGARTRNMDAFHSGKASTLVATDIAARGIHVDDVALVVHADPPTEHKAYLHRSGRTARAGAAGTVVTLMTDEQVRDVRALTRAAGIKPQTTKVDGAGHPLLADLAPGDRVLVPGGYVGEQPAGNQGGGNGGQGGGNGGGRRSGGGGRRRSGGGGQGGASAQAGQGGRGGRGAQGGRSQGQSAGSGSGGGGTGNGGGRNRRRGSGAGAAAGSGSNRNHSAASFSGRR